MSFVIEGTTSSQPDYTVKGEFAVVELITVLSETEGTAWIVYEKADPNVILYMGTGLDRALEFANGFVDTNPADLGEDCE